MTAACTQLERGRARSSSIQAPVWSASRLLANKHYFAPAATTVRAAAPGDDDPAIEAASSVARS